MEVRGFEPLASSVRDLCRAFLQGTVWCCGPGKMVRNARSVAVDGRIGGHDPPRFPGGIPGRYGHRLLPVCCPGAAARTFATQSEPAARRPLDGAAEPCLQGQARRVMTSVSGKPTHQLLLRLQPAADRGVCAMAHGPGWVSAAGERARHSATPDQDFFKASSRGLRLSGGAIYCWCRIVRLRPAADGTSRMVAEIGRANGRENG